MNEGTDMEKEICIAEVIGPNAGYQRFRSCAPWSDRNNKNPSSDLLVLLKAQKYALTRNLKTQVLSLNAYRYPMEKLQKLHELFGCIIMCSNVASKEGKSSRFVATAQVR